MTLNAEIKALPFAAQCAILYVQQSAKENHSIAFVDRHLNRYFGDEGRVCDPAVRARCHDIAVRLLGLKGSALIGSQAGEERYLVLLPGGAYLSAGGQEVEFASMEEARPWAGACATPGAEVVSSRTGRAVTVALAA